MNAVATDLFAGMDDLDSAPVKETRRMKNQVTITCPCCKGSGRKVYGYVNITSYACSMCKGKGKLTQERVNRFNGAKKAAKTAATNLHNRVKQFEADHKEVYDWIGKGAERGNEFYRSLYNQLADSGRLSEKQIVAVERSIAKAKEEKTKADANRPQVGAGALKMLEVFARALDNGYKRPTVRTEQFDFSLAPSAGANSGFIYVKSHETHEYIGKIDPTGKLFAYKAPQTTVDALMLVCENPLEAAVKFGAKTGICSCCGRELTNKESVELGIGPICRERFFG
jgi:uncharacterized CHY-type Zn-finger protein